MARKKRRRRILLLAIPAILVIGLIAYTPIALPVVTGYAAKKMCSCYFVAGIDSQTIEQEDLHLFPIRYAHNRIDYAEKRVYSRLLGSKATAVYREGLGCALVHELDPDKVQAQRLDIAPPDTFSPDTLPWPMGDLLADTLPAGIDQARLFASIDSAFDAPGTREKRTRAVVVVYKGQLIGEKYAPGFDRETRLHGWSMAKSIMNALVGILVKNGDMDIYQPAPIPEWQNDERKDITLHHLLQMSSGLSWTEGYFVVSDVTKMLFTLDGAAKYAISRPAGDPPNESWNYSSGTSNIVAQAIRNVMPSQEAYLRFPYDSLFYPLGMRSAILETDDLGTWVGSSFGWASARDWARFGMLYLNDGVWQGRRILPEGWVSYTATPADAGHGIYGAHFWTNQPEGMIGNFAGDESLPADMFISRGHDGQRVVVIPSRELVIVRLGLSEMNHSALIQGVLKALPVGD